jgi:chemotaxis signal transduction protein
MDGMGLEEVAKKHQRTGKGIKSRILINGLAMMDERGLSIEEVARMLHISETDLKHSKQRGAPTGAPKTKGEGAPLPPSGHQEIISILSDIRDYLKLIAEKT